MIKNMKSKQTWRYFAGIFLVSGAVLCSSCKKTESFSDNSPDKAAQAELKSTSKPFGLSLLLTGENKNGIGFVGEVTVTAKATNNTKYSFKKPVQVHFSVKDKNGPIADDFGAPVGATLVTSPDDIPQWKPGETITLSAHESITGKTDGVVRFLSKTLNPPLNKSVDISASADMDYAF